MDYSKDIERTKKYIEAHLFEDLSVEKIAATEGYSIFHFCRIFKENTGVSLMKYVREKRLSMADFELEKGETTADIAQKCGFETSSGFLRAYKRTFGKSLNNKIRA